MTVLAADERLHSWTRTWTPTQRRVNPQVPDVHPSTNATPWPRGQAGEVWAKYEPYTFEPREPCAPL